MPESSAERLLQRWRPYDSRRLTRRELRIEACSLRAFVAVAALACRCWSLPGRDFDPGVAVALIVSLALASRVRLYVGAGSAVPTQLVFVPMLFLLPPAVVPACVRRSRSPSRRRAAPPEPPSASSPSLADAGTPSAPHSSSPPLGHAERRSSTTGGVLALALAAQCATDLPIATAREWLGRGIAPAVQLRVIGNVYLIDACLTPVGLRSRWRAAGRPYALLLALPLLALLAVLATDRRRRIREAVGRLDELTAEHERLDRAIHRIGEAFASKLDRAALADIVVRTAVESLGRPTTGAPRSPSGTVEHGEQAPARRSPPPRTPRAARARCGSSPRRRASAMAQPLTGGAWAASTEVLAVCAAARRSRPTSRRSSAYLAQQTAVALENVTLHDQLRRQATVDEVTGLSNHRRFQEALAHEVTRMRRSERPTSLALIDIDTSRRSTTRTATATATPCCSSWPT